MLEFNPTSSPHLFAAPVDHVWVAYCWPPTGQPPPTQPIPLDQAMTGPGAFLFATAPGLDINTAAADLVVAVTGALANYSGGPMAIGWLLDPTQINAANVNLLGINNTANLYVNAQLSAQLVNNRLYLYITSGCSVSLDAASGVMTFTPTSNNLRFYGDGAPQSAIITSATLAFTGPSAGTLQFTTSIKRDELYTNLRWGFQLLYDTGSSANPVHSQWYPLADGAVPDGADMLGFAVSIDTCDPTNARVDAKTGARIADRTYFAFTDPAAVLVSGFRTSFNDVINLQPITQPQGGEQAAKLVLATGNPNTPNPPDYSFGPQGDFIMMLAAPKDGASSHMLCGLTPTETLSFTASTAANPSAGNRLRFTAYCKAFATSYPPPTSSSLGIPIDPNAPKINDSYRTPWVTVIPGPRGDASQYSAQPKGSPLFGFDKVVAPSSEALLGFVDPGYALARPDPFPMMPYGLVPLESGGVSFSEHEIGGIEQFAAATTRRTLIGAPGASQPRRALRMLDVVAADSNADWVTTPSGLLAELDQSAGHWNSVLLGVNNDAGPMWMLFNNPPPKLQQALQTADLFLVAANATHLGALAPMPAGAKPPAPDGTPTFYNTMSIQDWQISANVGQSNVYNDYNNILIIKGCKGKLVDLVAKPDVWTQREDFSVPGIDPTETVILAQWIATYIQEALDQTSPYFDHFKSIVNDDNWTGILVLKASLTDLPRNLSGLLSVIDKSQCFAHHFGITITPVGIDRTQANPKVAITNSSSIFQLVYYVDPEFDQTNPQPLPPSNSPYDFKLLTLAALFKNTAVKSFDSYAQLTLGAFFGDSVSHMGDDTNIYNTIMLKGAYQQNGGVGTFMLDSIDDNLFFLDSATFNKVEITKAQFNTVGPTSLSFDLWGFFDYALLPAVDSKTLVPFTFDLFSFGSTADNLNVARQGLSVSGLSIDLDSSTIPWVFNFDVSAVTFDPSRSTPRKGSLYTDFALSLKGLLSGDDSSDASSQTDPGSLNYLNMPTNAPLSGVAGGLWYALQFGVDLGSVGALASNAGLNASMLAAWAPGGAPPPGELAALNVMAGLRLPGVTAKNKLLSLEGVLQLSIGDIRLTYAPPDDSSTTRYWVLWLSDIALKFLGLLKIPPNGAISFACFGNPDANGQPGALGWYAVYNQDKDKEKQNDAQRQSLLPTGRTS
jgi:hypothetical protein